MSLHVGASVDVVAGNYEGQRGTVTKLTAQQVYVDLSSGASVRIAQTSVCVRSGAVTPPGAGTPPGARAGPAVPPVTQQQSRRTRRPVLTVSEDSSRTGWIGQPPILNRHEVVTIDGDVETLGQATP